MWLGCTNLLRSVNEPIPGNLMRYLCFTILHSFRRSMMILGSLSTPFQSTNPWGYDALTINLFLLLYRETIPATKSGASIDFDWLDAGVQPGIPDLLHPRRVGCGWALQHILCTCIVWKIETCIQSNLQLRVEIRLVNFQEIFPDLLWLSSWLKHNKRRVRGKVDNGDADCLNTTMPQGSGD